MDEVRGEWDVSIRRACRLFMFDTSSYHYRSRRPGQAVLENRIKEICQTRVRYGYRRVHVLLRREGWKVNAKRIYRLYDEESLKVRSVERKKIAGRQRIAQSPAVRPNQDRKSTRLNSSH